MLRFPISFVPEVASATPDVTSRANYVSALSAATSEPADAASVDQISPRWWQETGRHGLAAHPDEAKRPDLKSLPNSLNDIVTSQETKTFFFF